MTFELRTPAASDRAEAERERVEEKVAAFETFAERVREVTSESPRNPGRSVTTKTTSTSAVGSSASGASVTATNVTASNATLSNATASNVTASNATLSNATASNVTASNANGDVTAVREAFGETVLPYAEENAVGEALADELSPDLAVALSPAAGGLSAELADQLVSRAETRQKECGLLADAIETERDRVGDVADELGAVVDWLAEADETPLLQLGFEELRERHDRLGAFRETCDQLVQERQATIRGTQQDGLTGIRERELLDHLYGDFEDSHPMLADAARLDELLADCQRAVRRHLCARV